MYILAEKHINLNRERSPCTDYEEMGTSFTECLAENVMKLTNCKVNK